MFEQLSIVHNKGGQPSQDHLNQVIKKQIELAADRKQMGELADDYKILEKLKSKKLKILENRKVRALKGCNL